MFHLRRILFPRSLHKNGEIGPPWGMPLVTSFHEILLINKISLYKAKNIIRKANHFNVFIVFYLRRILFPRSLHKSGEIGPPWGMPLVKSFHEILLPKMEFITVSFNMFPVHLIIRWTISRSLSMPRNYANTYYSLSKATSWSVISSDFPFC